MPLSDLVVSGEKGRPFLQESGWCWAPLPGDTQCGGPRAEEQDTQHLKGPDVPLERRSLALEPAHQCCDDPQGGHGEDTPRQAARGRQAAQTEGRSPNNGLVVQEPKKGWSFRHDS